jgi:uncharacterized protein YbjT (DUF2867 family)
MKKQQTILVTGATGAQGGSVARELLSNKKFNVRILTRNASSEIAKELQEEGAEIVTGDLNDRESLKKALKDVYGVFGVTSFWEHHEKECVLGKNLADAVKEAGIQHFVFSTLPNYSKISKGQFQVPHYDIKALLQEYTKSLGIPATFVHAAFYYENFLTFFPLQKDDNDNYFFGFPQGETKLAMASAADMGGVVSTIFNFPTEYIGRTVAVVGESRTCAEYAQIISKILRVNVQYKYIPGEEFAASGSLLAEEFASMFEVQRLFIPDHQLSLIESYGLNPSMQTFEKWLVNNKYRFNIQKTSIANRVSAQLA